VLVHTKASCCGLPVRAGTSQERFISPFASEPSLQWSFIAKSAKSGLTSARARGSHLHAAGLSTIAQQLTTSGIRKDRWVAHLRGGHDGDLVAFCAGSAILNGRAGGTAAFAVYFPLQDDLLFTKPDIQLFLRD
jgi:hypothetical protein